MMEHYTYKALGSREGSFTKMEIKFRLIDTAGPVDDPYRVLQDVVGHSECIGLV